MINNTLSKNTLLDKFDPNCPVRNVLSRISDKWSLLVLFTLEHGGTIRFKEIHRALPDISQKMLTVTLRTLEQDGFVTRKAYAVVPPKVEYSLTERAHSLLPHVNALSKWAKENMNDIIAERKKNYE